MPDVTIQPTLKFIKAGAILASVVFLGLEVLCLFVWLTPAWVIAIPPLILLWPASHMIRRRFTKTTITGDRLRYETGITSKSTRSIQLSKLQDVRVDQKLSQRVFNVGNLSLETAGEASRLTIPNVDDPQNVADEILNRAQKGSASV